MSTLQKMKEKLSGRVLGSVQITSNNFLIFARVSASAGGDWFVIQNHTRNFPFTEFTIHVSGAAFSACMGLSDRRLSVRVLHYVPLSQI